MDSSIIVVVVICALAFGLLIWLEVHSRRKKRSEGGGGVTPGGLAKVTEETAEGG